MKIKKEKIKAYRIIRYIDEKNRFLSWIKVYYKYMEISITPSTYINYIRYEGTTYGFDRLIWDEDNQLFIGIMATSHTNKYDAESAVNGLINWEHINYYDDDHDPDEFLGIYERLQWGVI
jgi:hypothetical protein